MKVEDTYSFEGISQVRQKERRKALSKIPFDFYEELAKRIQGHKERYQHESGKAPSSMKTIMYADEIRKTKLIFDEIFRQRSRKVVLAAFGSVMDGSGAPSELLPNEKEMYDRMVEILKGSKDRMEQMAGEAPEQEAPTEMPSEVDIVNKVSQSFMAPVDVDLEEAAKQEGQMEESAEAPTVMVRVLEDIGSFVGTDERTYNLKKEDIVELPVSVAELLKSRNTVEVFSS